MTKKPTIALVTIVKNERRGIVEHLCYHLGVHGFDKAIVYDNCSTDGTRDRVRQVRQVYDVDLVLWADGQLDAYLDAVKRLAAEGIDWALFLDGDERLHATSGKTVESLLARIPDDVDQVCLPWAVFGSAGHDRAPLGTEMVNFDRRAPLGYHLNRHTKALVRSQEVLGCATPHAFQVRGRTVDGRLNDVEWGEGPGVLRQALTRCEWRVNHYAARSRQHWEERCRRGQAISKDADMAARWAAFDRNDEHDVSAKVYYGAALDRALAGVLFERVEDLPEMAGARVA